MREFRVEAVTTRCEDILDTAEEMQSRSESDPGFTIKAMRILGNCEGQRTLYSLALEINMETQRNCRHF
jgi:hypothetical protein